MLRFQDIKAGAHSNICIVLHWQQTVGQLRNEMHINAMANQGF